MGTADIRSALKLQPSVSDMFREIDSLFLYDILDSRFDVASLVKQIKFHVPEKRTRETHFFYENKNAKDPINRPMCLWNRMDVDATVMTREQIRLATVELLSIWHITLIWHNTAGVARAYDRTHSAQFLLEMAQRKFY
jgi:hypothetical protein